MGCIVLLNTLVILLVSCIRTRYLLFDVRVIFEDATLQ